PYDPKSYTLSNCAKGLWPTTQQTKLQVEERKLEQRMRREARRIAKHARTIPVPVSLGMMTVVQDPADTNSTFPHPPHVHIRRNPARSAYWAITAALRGVTLSVWEGTMSGEGFCARVARPG